MAVIKNFSVILKPAAVNDRAVRQNKCAAKIHALYHFQSGKRFSEAHFCVPQHFAASACFFELLYCFFNRFGLFRAKHDWAFVLRNFICVERCASCFYSGDGFLYRFQIRVEPFVRLMFIVKYFALYARTDKHIMHFVVLKNH